VHHTDKGRPTQYGQDGFTNVPENGTAGKRLDIVPKVFGGMAVLDAPVGGRFVVFVEAKLRTKEIRRC